LIPINQGETFANTVQSIYNENVGPGGAIENAWSFSNQAALIIGWCNGGSIPLELLPFDCSILVLSLEDISRKFIFINNS
jgi:hypothetical protein